MTYASRIDLSTGSIIISEEEYDENAEEGTIVQGNGHKFDSQELKEMKSKFKKFQIV